MDVIFASHKLNLDAEVKVQRVREHFDALLQGIQPDIAGGGRYESLTKTKLEEACMMAVKAIATQPANWLR